MDGVTYDSLPALQSGATEILCTNTYSPPGTNVPVLYPLPLNSNLLAGISGGGDVTFLFYAADDQIGYLFNSDNFTQGNQPMMHVVASPLLKILSGAFTNGAFFLAGVGGDDATYQIQASTNLAATNWQTIGTAASDDNGAIQYYDFGATNQQWRYYRFSQ
jgi:hypothetical protein